MSEQTTEGAVGLIAEWQADLQAGYIDEPTVTDVRIGVFYTAVEISTGIWPGPFFTRGVDVLGGIRVRNGRQLLEIVGQGGSGYFFEQAAEKCCVIRPPVSSGARAAVI